MKKTIIKKAMHATDFLNEPIEYGKLFSRGIRVSFADKTMLFISGTASIDEKGKTFLKGDFFGQTKRTFDNISALLKSEKATWHDVVQTRCYLKNMRNYQEFNLFRNWFFRTKRIKPFPASVCIEANLCRPDLLVEIEAIAILENPARNKPRAKIL